MTSHLELIVICNVWTLENTISNLLKLHQAMKIWSEQTSTLIKNSIDRFIPPQTTCSAENERSFGREEPESPSLFTFNLMPVSQWISC